MTLCTLTLTLFLAVPCLAQAARPTAVTPQQADDIVDHLISSLADYVFPERRRKIAESDTNASIRVSCHK